MKGFFEVHPVAKKETKRKLIVHFSSKKDMQSFSELEGKVLLLKLILFGILAILILNYRLKRLKDYLI